MSKSSCAASCSMYCRLVSCASATSDSSPTGTVLRCCRCAFDCSAAQWKGQLRPHHRPPARLTRSGTVQSAAEPCALSNGSPRLNSSFAHHRNQTGALHESQSTASALARALARTQIPCLNWPRLVRYRSLHLPHDPSVRRFPTQFIHPSGSSYPLQRVHALTKHIRPHSKYIGFPVGGFLQVAVSEAPSQSACKLELLRAGAPDTALRELAVFGLEYWFEDIDVVLPLVV